MYIHTYMRIVFSYANKDYYIYIYIYIYLYMFISAWITQKDNKRNNQHRRKTGTTQTKQRNLYKRGKHS